MRTHLTDPYHIPGQRYTQLFGVFFTAGFGQERSVLSLAGNPAVTIAADSYKPDRSLHGLSSICKTEKKAGSEGRFGKNAMILCPDSPAVTAGSCKHAGFRIPQQVAMQRLTPVLSRADDRLRVEEGLAIDLQNAIRFDLRSGEREHKR